MRPTVTPYSGQTGRHENDALASWLSPVFTVDAKSPIRYGESDTKQLYRPLLV